MLYREYCDDPTKSILKCLEKQAYKILFLGVWMNITVLFWWDVVTSWLPRIPIWGTVGVNLYVNSMALCILTVSINHEIWLQKLLSLRIFHILGKTTYSFYLLNDLGLWMFGMACLLRSKKGVFSVWEVVLAILMSLFWTQVASVVWYILFEKPSAFLSNIRKSSILP